VCDPGESIDTGHDETDSGQQEVYVVVAGRIEFTLGDAVGEAGPGTIVAAPDPAVPRSFRPLEPGTRVVCIGAAASGDAPAFGEWIADAAS
jgi:mannose-6-phosphate isomerase-like protein (cupin superfamily)